MKRIILSVIVTLAFTFSNAQELRVNETDEFTGDSKRVTKTYKLANGNAGKLEVSAIKVGPITGIFVESTADLGCSGAKGNYIIFKFSDDTTLKLDDDADIECGDDAQSLFVVSPSDFRGKVVIKVRFNQSEYYDDCIPSGNWTFNELIDAVN